MVGTKSTLTAGCLGRVEDRGDIDAATERSIAEMTRNHPRRVAQRLSDELVAGERATRYRIVCPSGPVGLWRFAHVGWLFGASYRCLPPDDEIEIFNRARAVLDTWQWQ